MEVDLEFILFPETKEVKTKQNIDLKYINADYLEEESCVQCTLCFVVNVSILETPKTKKQTNKQIESKVGMYGFICQ